MAAEDFSFPTFTDTISSAIDSPPLWRLSPAASPDYRYSKNNNKKEEDISEEEEEEEEEYKDCFPVQEPIKITQRKSFSWIEKGSPRLAKSDDGEEEERMDMLWEDFNEELSIERNYSTSSFDSKHHQEIMVQSLRLSKNTSRKAMVPTRKSSASDSAAGFVVFIKVLKKLFLLHNSHHSSVHQNHCSRTRRSKNHSW